MERRQWIASNYYYYNALTLNSAEGAQKKRSYKVKVYEWTKEYRLPSGLGAT
jgi:hypothetical protein